MTYCAQMSKLHSNKPQRTPINAAIHPQRVAKCVVSHLCLREDVDVP
jgi:hypothetical protein